jgi:hypothetical protein
LENYCTLFDSNYLTRGIALISSLRSLKEDFHLYVFAFDDLTEEVLNEIDFDEVTVINKNKLENEELILLKEKRSKAEYCWTCTPLTILYCLENFKMERCTYLDADIYFFSSPIEILKEMENKFSILITKHNYSKKYDQTSIRGKYCVQFMSFNNDVEGLKALKWWKEKCIDWCYAYYEDGKFGDQMYLDDWTERFERVCISAKLGCGIAPWNIRDYLVEKTTKNILVKKKENLESDLLIFYHFHFFKLYDDGDLRYSYYEIPKSAKKFIYKTYLKELLEAELKLKNINPELRNFFRETKPRKNIIEILRRMKSYLNGTSNRISIKKAIIEKN